MTTSTKPGFKDLLHNISVGPMAAEGVERELLAGGHKRIQPLNAEAFQMSYTLWTLNGYRQKVLQTHHAELEQRIRRVNPQVP